jgi:hypothetical protein
MRTALARLVPVAFAASLVLAAAACSDDDDGDEPAATGQETSVLPTLAPPEVSTEDCGLLSPSVPGSTQYCNALDEIEDGTVEVAGGAEFCTAAADAPPELVPEEFWGKTAVMVEIRDYFATVAPLAPDSMADQTQQLADLADQYVENLQARDAGDVSAEEAEAQFRAVLDPILAEQPDLVTGWYRQVVTACTPTA